MNNDNVYVLSMMTTSVITVMFQTLSEAHSHVNQNVGYF